MASHSSCLPEALARVRMLCLVYGKPGQRFTGNPGQRVSLTQKGHGVPLDLTRLGEILGSSEWLLVSRFPGSV